MKKVKLILPIAVSVIIFMMLLFDANAAIKGAGDGIDVCIKSVIPSLFPFIVVSCYLNNKLAGLRIKPLSFICKICKIPPGCETILIPAYLGGYPVGAQSINDLYLNDYISQKDAQRLLAFCNNAGPAFIFGFGSTIFKEQSRLWIIWLINIFSSILIGSMIPANQTQTIISRKTKEMSISEAITKSIRSMATICGWVVIFRTLIAIAGMQSEVRIPYIIRTAITGALELTNGCVALLNTDSTSLKFLFFSCFVSFGGLCVHVQTLSAAKDVGPGYYFPSKIMQCAIACILTIIADGLIYSGGIPEQKYLLMLPLLLMLTLFIFFFIKNSSNRKKNVV